MLKSSAYFDLIVADNLTTGMNMFKATKELRFEALEFDREFIIIECGNRSCNVGHLIKLEGFICTPTDRADFTAVARVKSLEPLDNSMFSVTVQFLQYNRDLWDRFFDYLLKRQEKVDQLFLAMHDEA